MGCKYCEPAEGEETILFCEDYGLNENLEPSGYAYYFDGCNNEILFKDEWKFFDEGIGLLPKSEESPEHRLCHSSFSVSEGKMRLGLAYGNWGESKCIDMYIKAKYCPFCGRKFNV